MSLFTQIAVAGPFFEGLWYQLPQELNRENLVGCRVRVPLGRREVTGIVLCVSTQQPAGVANFKSVLSVLDKDPIYSQKLQQWCAWVAEYYQANIGDVFATAFPKQLWKGAVEFTLPRAASSKSASSVIAEASVKNLSSEQQQVVDNIQQQRDVFGVHLLAGITGSGKTEVYLRLIKSIIADGKQALMLVPEIGLTPQALSRLQTHFGSEVVSYHSQMTATAQRRVWYQVKHNEVSVVIGTRSAVWLPFAKCGLLILDEEHDLSYKQQSGLRYSARDIAIYRGQLERFPIILGSATPSLESLDNADKGRYQLWRLTRRVGQAKPPTYHIVNLQGTKQNEGISSVVIKQVEKHLMNQGQVLFFLNRRGFAPMLRCNACGWLAECPCCDVKLALHHLPKPKLQCHHCGYTSYLPTSCPTCQSTELQALGVGTERVEAALHEWFPAAKIHRLDRDNTQSKQKRQEILTDMVNGDADILLGTQMLAKGHHFPRVTMVVVVNVDNALFSADFRALERLGQLVTQVAGRAGRAEKAGEVYLQTHYPDHPVLRDLLQLGYMQYAQLLLQERQQAGWPPAAYSAMIWAESKSLSQVERFFESLSKKITAASNGRLKKYGPAPALLSRRGGYYRWQLLLLASKRSYLHQQLAEIRHYLKSHKVTGVRWEVDVDPLDVN